MDAFSKMLKGGDPKDNKDNKPNQVSEEHQPLTNKPNTLTSFADNIGSFKDTIRGQVDNATDAIAKQTSVVKDGLNASITKLDEGMKSTLNQYKEKINKWVVIKIQSTILNFLEKMRPKVKEGAKDPDMCLCVKNLIDDMVDDVWPEIMEEVQYSLMMGTQQPFIEIPHQKIFCLCLPFVKLRNWYLYSMSPYDRSIWKQLKTISWWFWTLVSAIPFYGVSQYFYVLDFMIRDTSDEYQLVTFILGIKTMYFVTQGVLKSIIGYFLFYSCTTMINQSATVQQSTAPCTRKGPGASIQVFAEVVGFFVQIIAIWMAFILLSCSSQKGKPQFKYDDSRVSTAKHCIRGGRIKYFMLFDFFALLVSVGLFFVVYEIQKSPTFDNSGDFIYFAEVCYGLLSFPFLLFNIPILKDRLTKAKPTAYDKKGNCVPTSKDIKVNYAQESKQNGYLQSLSIDVGEVFDG